MTIHATSAVRLRQLPDTAPERALLARRAAELAGDADGGRSQESSEEYLRVRIGEREDYGIAYAYLDEIAYATNLTRVPCTPPFVHGVMNRRGEMLTVFDLGTLLHSTARDGSKETARVVVIRGQGQTVGLLVDEVVGNETYFPSRLTPPMPPAGGSDKSYVRGIYGARVAMLDSHAVLADPALVVNETNI